MLRFFTLSHLSLFNSFDILIFSLSLFITLLVFFIYDSHEYECDEFSEISTELLMAVCL